MEQQTKQNNRKIVVSFSTRLEKFNNLPIIVHIYNDYAVGIEFDEKCKYSYEEVIKEVERIVQEEETVFGLYED